MTADPRARWAELLRAPRDAPPEAATAAFLRTLPGDGFLPPAERVAAANALAGTSVATGRDPDVEQLLRDEVEAFAAGYWMQAPGDRLTWWADLFRRGADSARLRELEPGLDVAAVILTDPITEELAVLIRALFVMPSRPRAIRRNEWLLDHAAEADKWRAALAGLLRDAPELAALEPRLVGALAPDFGPALTAFVEGGSAAAVGQSVVAGVADFASRTREYDRDPHYDYEARDHARAKKFLKGTAIAFLLLIAYCAISGIINRPSRESAIYKPPAGNKQPQPLAYSAPVYTPPPLITAPWPTVNRFTIAEVNEFERYEKEKAAGNNPKEPLTYAGWRLAGRPRGVADVAPSRLTISFDREQIEACENYDRAPRAFTRPILYGSWYAAGKPTTPGTYPLAIPNP